MSSPALHNLFQLINTQLLTQQQTPANTISSSFNIATCISMLADAAAGKSREELVKFFGFAPPTSPDFKISLRSNELAAFREILTGNSAAMVKTAQALFVSKAILPSYIAKTQELYRAVVKPIDPTNPKQTITDVNNFVAAQTQGHIKQLLPDNAVDASTVAVLVAALFFKGKWAQPFPVQSTSEREFFLNDTTSKKVPTMSHKKKNVVVLNKNHVVTVSIPYEGDELCFVAEIHESKKALPVSDFETVKACAMTKPGTGVGHQTGNEVTILLPKFKASCGLSLVDLLKSAGVTTIFDPTQRDFAQMSEAPIFVSDIFHKAFVEVDEEGTVAAAATAVVARLACISKQNDSVNLNRPFHFHICHKKTGVALFSGSVCDPSVA